MPIATAATQARVQGAVDRADQRSSREHGMSYSVFMNGLKKAAIEVDRKVLADIAVADKPAFMRFVEQARRASARKQAHRKKEARRASFFFTEFRYHSYMQELESSWPTRWPC